MPDDPAATGADDAATAESFVRASLAEMEADTRELALVALADWAATDIVSTDLFTPIAGMQRPSWGVWNGLLLALRRARRTALRGAERRERVALGEAVRLTKVVETLSSPLDEDRRAALRPLARWVHVPLARRATLQHALALAIHLRNRVAHDAPSEAEWWSAAERALNPLVAIWRGLVERSATEPVAPWLVARDGTLYAFHGLDGAGGARYVARFGPTFVAGDLGADVRLALQRLLGRADLQEADFRRLLGRLAPEEVRGVLLGDFVVGRTIGEGGFATVHVSYQLSTGRKVAVKVLRDGTSPEVRERFRREAAYLSRFDHPNIVRVYGYGEDAWTPPRAFRLDDEPWYQEFSRGARVRSYIALAWVDGRTLEDVYRSADAPLEPRSVARWFADAAGALATVHANGLVHGDVKPSNVMVMQDGVITIMDFGVARSFGENRILQTETGCVLGTPAYMSPEQIRAEDADAEVGPQTDVYSLCALFFELLTRTRLLDHDRESPANVRARKLDGRRPAIPAARARRLPWELRRLVLGGLEPEPSDRPPSMDALERDLRAYLEEQPIRYVRPSWHRRLRLAYRRSRLAANVALVAFLVVVGAVAWYLWTVARYTALVETEYRRAETQRAVAESQREEAELQRAVAEKRRGEADAARARAERETRLAAAREKTAAVQFVLATESLLPADAVVRTLEAHAVAPSDGSRHIMQSFVSSYGRRIRMLPETGNSQRAADSESERAVTAMAFCPDTGCLVTGGADGSLRRWDLTTGAPTLIIERGPRISSIVFTGAQQVRVHVRRGEYSGEAGALAVDLDTKRTEAIGKPWAYAEGDHGVSPDGRFRWVLEERRGEDGYLRDVVAIRRAADAAEVLLADARDSFSGIRFSPSSRFLAVTTMEDAILGPYVVEVWDLSETRLLASFSDDAADEPLALGVREPRLLSRRAGQGRLYDGRRQKEVLRFLPDGGEIGSAALSPDGRYAAAGDDTGQTIIWEATTRAVSPGLAEFDHPTSAVLDPSGERLFVWHEEGLRISDLRTGRPLATIARSEALGIEYDSAFSTGGRFYARWSDSERTVRVWETDTGRRVFEHVFAPPASIWEVALAPGGEYVVVRTLSPRADGLGPPPNEMTDHVWALPLGRPVALPALDAVGAVATTADGGYEVRTPWTDARLWARRADGRKALLFDGRDYDTAGALSWDGHLLAHRQGNLVRILDSDSLDERAAVRLEAHANALGFGPGGELLITVESGGVVRSWRSSDGAPVASATLDDVVCDRLSFVAREGLVALPGEGRLVLWDPRTGREVRELPLPGQGAAAWVGGGDRYALVTSEINEYWGALFFLHDAWLVEAVEKRLPPSAVAAYRNFLAADRASDRDDVPPAEHDRDRP